MNKFIYTDHPFRHKMDRLCTHDNDWLTHSFLTLFTILITVPEGVHYPCWHSQYHCNKNKAPNDGWRPNFHYHNSDCFRTAEPELHCCPLRHYLNLLQCLLIVGFATVGNQDESKRFYDKPHYQVFRFGLPLWKSNQFQTRRQRNHVSIWKAKSKNLIHREIIGSRGLISVLTFNSLSDTNGNHKNIWHNGLYSGLPLVITPEIILDQTQNTTPPVSLKVNSVWKFISSLLPDVL